MTYTIYKATPGETLFEITELAPDTHFVGNDVTDLNVKTKSYGTLHILDADSLTKISVKNNGLTIVFSKFPKNDVKIDGPVEEVRIQHKDKQYCLHRYTSNPNLPFDEINGVQISRFNNFLSTTMDALILLTNKSRKLEIKQDCSHILIIGDKELQQATIEGDGLIRSLEVHDSKNLDSLRVNERVVRCQLLHCPKISTIVGFGDYLRIRPTPKNVSDIGIGGFWHEAPDWYDSKMAELKIKHFNADLSPEDIRKCKDMGGIKITPHTYEGPGGLCEFSESLGLSIDEISLGIYIPEFVKMVLENEDSFAIFANWCDSHLTHFQQYIAMRILASLSSNGFDLDPILGVRRKILKFNVNMPKLITESVNDGYLGGKWNDLYSTNKKEWEIPSNSVMPYGRLDLEIWLNSDLGIEFMTQGIDYASNRISRNFRSHLGKSDFVRNLIVSTLSAANRIGRNATAEAKLNLLVEMLYTNPLINMDPYCCEFTILHLGSQRIGNSKIVNELIKGIMSMHTDSWVKAALLIGIIHQIDSPKARLSLGRLVSGKEFTVSQSNAINAISVAGRRAFESGKAPEPKWPYVRNWSIRMRELNERN